MHEKRKWCEDHTRLFLMLFNHETVGVKFLIFIPGDVMDNVNNG